MIIQRLTWQTQPGCMEEAISLLKAEMARTGKSGSIQYAEFGPFDELLLELTWESLAEQDEYWAAYFATPEAQVFSQNFDPLRTAAGKNEIWGVTQPEILKQREEPAHLINRRTFRVKPMQMENILKLLTRDQNPAEPIPDYRILTTAIGQFNQLILDFRGASFDEYTNAWEEWNKRETTKAFFEGWITMVEPGGTNEMWVEV